MNNSLSTTQGQYSTFNARWLSPEQVARTFVPIPQFRLLVHNSSSILLGPRGCGKTTLLKMLTRRALRTWNEADRSKRFKGAFDLPTYEAVYVPSDIRWSHELSTLAGEPFLPPQAAETVQRVLVTLSSLRAVVAAIADVAVEPTAQTPISLKLIQQWKLRDTLPQFRDISHSLDAMASKLRGLLSRGDHPCIFDLINKLPPEFYGFVLDAPIDACRIASDFMQNSGPHSWGFCYDELEIAPAWLRQELLLALRSVPPGNLLKLTCSPMLPSGIKSAPESLDDYRPIRLWSSYVQDPKPFCEDLTRDFLLDRFPGVEVTVDEFLHRSILASEGVDGEPVDAYDPGSTEYIVFKEVAAWDRSFAHLLKERHYDPEHPVPRTVEDKDQFFRKVKPIALLRREFLFEARGRSRKSVALFAGKEAVFAMSEGNPRRLLGLLNDLADFGTSLSDLARTGKVGVRYIRQARILASASNRYLSQIKATPQRVKSDISLLDFIVRVGRSFQSEIYDRDFPLDPIGSFEVPEGVDSTTAQSIEQLLELGAIVHIGSSPHDVPVTVTGCRFRLSFMLTPTFRLPFRIYRSAPLGDILSGRQVPGQLELLFDTSRED